MKILMVCLGNICRSPLAEGILRDKVQKRNLDWEVDSAGTSGWHDGEPPDRRSIATARNHGLDISTQVSRKFQPTDLDYFDVIYVMDESNLREVHQYCRNEEQRSRVCRIMDVLPGDRYSNVPDPYFGEYGFELVYELLDRACDKIIENAVSGE